MNIGQEIITRAELDLVRGTEIKTFSEFKIILNLDFGCDWLAPDTKKGLYSLYLETLYPSNPPKPKFPYRDPYTGNRHYS